MNDDFITVYGSIYRKTAIDAVFIQRAADENFAVHIVCNGVDIICMSFRFSSDADMLREEIITQMRAS